MPLRLLAAVFEENTPGRAALFWAGLLSRDVVETPYGVLLPGDATQIGLAFRPARTDRVGPNRMHLHLTSGRPGDQQRTVDTALQLGARHVDVGQRPDEDHVVLADPDGNEFCVIEAGNAYLAGCGFLGELACDGTREVGLFWSQALGWPLVWDQDQETAVQTSHGVGRQAAVTVTWGQAVSSR